MAYKRRISDLSEYRKEYKVRGGVEMTVEGELWHTRRRISDLNEYRKDYKVRGGFEMTVEGELWHTKEEFPI